MHVQRTILIVLGFLMIPFSLTAQTPQVELQLQPPDGVGQMVFSPDGKWLAMGASDIRLLHIPSQKIINLGYHKNRVLCLAISPNGRYLASGDGKGDIYVWDMLQSKMASVLHDTTGSQKILFSEDGANIIACQSFDVHIWNLAQRKKIKSYPFFDAQEKIRLFPNSDCSVFDYHGISPDGKWAAIAGNTSCLVSRTTEGGYKLPGFDFNQFFQAINLETGEILEKIRIPKEMDLGAVALGRQKLALVVSTDKTTPATYKALIYNLETQSIYRQINADTNRIVHLALSPDESKLVGVSAFINALQWAQGSVLMWDIPTSRLIGTNKMAYHKTVFSADGYWLAGGFDTYLLAAPVKNFPRGVYTMGPEYSANVYDFVLDEDRGKILFSDREHVMTWDIKRGVLSQKFVGSGDQTIRGVAFTAKGILTAGFRGSIVHWDSSGKNQIARMQHPVLNLKNITRIDDSTYASYGTGIPSLNQDTLRFWNVYNGALTRIQTAHSDKINGMRRSPDEKIWVTFGGEEKNSPSGSVCVWDATQWTKTGDYHISDQTTEVIQVLIYPDNKTALIATDHAERIVMNLHDGSIIRRMNDSGNYAVTMEFSPDGALYACGNGGPWLLGSSDYHVRIYDAESHRLVKILKGHTNKIEKLQFTKDGRTLVTGSLDGTIKFWNLSNQEVTSLIGVSEDTYVLFTENGYYMTSKAGRDLVAFRSGMKLMTFDQFDLAYNRPDVILARLGHTPPEQLNLYKQAYEKRRLRNEGVVAAALIRDDAPDIDVTTDTPPETNTSAMPLKVKIRDAKNNLKTLKVMVNDVPVYGRAGLDLRGRNAQNYETDMAITLSEGKNRIQISAINTAGVESIPETFETTFSGWPEPTDVICVSVGIANYQDPDYNLTYSRKDAEEMAAAFETMQKNQRGIFEKIILTDTSAVKENILAIKKRLMQTRPNDRVILFFAGHGLLDEKLDWYFATYDTDFRNPSKRGLGYSEIENLLDGIPARRRLVLMDACHSGEVDKETSAPVMTLVDGGPSSVSARGLKQKIGIGENPVQNVNSRGFLAKKTGAVGLQNSFDLMRELFADLQNGIGATVISSASGTELALEGGEWKNGVFTYSVLQGLTNGKADLDHDGIIRCSELQTYVTQSVKQLTQGKQTPTARKEKMLDNFEVVKFTGPIDPSLWRKPGY